MFAFGDLFSSGLEVRAFLDQYATAEQKSRWQGVREKVKLTLDQRSLLESFTREMKVVVMAGAWCGDCINQCPIFDEFAATTSKIVVRYFDRDANPELAAELQTCGAARVPCVVFLSEDGQFCGRYGDRTISKYRKLMSSFAGATCPTGLVTPEDEIFAVTADWLVEFERIHAMLRTSNRLRQIHGD